MEHQEIQIGDRKADGYVIPLGPVSLVFALSGSGLVGCGAFDVAALDKFEVAAARVKAVDGGSIATLDDLLNGVVKDANDTAAESGIKPGMKGRDALQLL